MQQGLQSPVPHSFQHCHGHGCRFKTDITFTTQDWSDIDALFSPSPANAVAERQIIKHAIALFEQRVGQRAGTAKDKPGTTKMIQRHQLDCVDESTNTTVYLILLKQKGLLRMHEIAAPDVRLPIFHSGFWPHQSAVITDRNSGQAYVVDSWFHANGVAPEIIPLDTWKDGWNPSTTVY